MSKTHLKYIQYLFILFLILLGGYMINELVVNKPLTPLEEALQVAGDNRSELEKVLRHYQADPADSLKYRAACFLIENMPFYAFSSGKQMDNYKSYYTWLKKSRDKTPQQVADSVVTLFGPIGHLEEKRDILEIDSAYLCNNIEWSFKVWREQPWGKHISFEMFCEYLLPYRIGNEPLTNWREMYYEKYSYLLDSLRMSDSPDKDDPAFAADYLRKRLPDKEHYYTTVAPYHFGNIGPEYAQYLSGSCNDVADFGIYLFRALGIPCAIDFFPVLSYGNSSHYWVMVWDKNGEDYLAEMPGNFELVRMNGWYKTNESSKVYRYTFSVNRNMYEDMVACKEEIYPFWRLPRFIDVTREYSYSYKKELKIPASRIYEDRKNVKLAYLCLSSRNNWIPIDWTIAKPDGNIIFKNVRKGATMRVATFKGGAICFLTDPFYVDRETNAMHYFSGEKEKQDVILYAKYPINEENDFRNKMIGGVFEGSNNPDFSDKDTLFMVQSKPFRLKTNVRSWSDRMYRYFRYVGVRKAHCNIAEIAFYESGNDTTPLKGKVIGRLGDPLKVPQQGYGNAMDGKTWTSFNDISPSGGWVGLDAGKRVRVDRIEYTPRNRDNYIRPGDVFELFYCDRDWILAGTQKATSDSLVFHNIPQNRLLLLRNRSRGMDERIFIYEKGAQIWK